MSTQLVANAYKVLSANNLYAYVSWVNKLPLLTKDEEYRLGVRLKSKNDLDAARQLVLSHLRYVVRIARNYLGYGLTQADLIQEGNVGLMKAVKRFDPDRGVSLAVFASHWIKSEIHEFILKNWCIVKVATTKAQRKLFFNLRRMTKSFKKRASLTTAQVKSIAEKLSVKMQDVKTMEMRLLDARDESFESVNDGFGHFSPEDYMSLPAENPEHHIENIHDKAYRSEQLYKAINCLDSRSQDIIRQRCLSSDKATTLKALADQYKISIERARQIESEAKRRLKKFLVEME